MISIAILEYVQFVELFYENDVQLKKSTENYLIFMVKTIVYLKLLIHELLKDGSGRSKTREKNIAIVYKEILIWFVEVLLKNLKYALVGVSETKTSHT